MNDTKYEIKFMFVFSRLFMHMHIRTNAFGPVVVQTPTSFTRLAFLGTIHRTPRAGLWDAVLTYARVHCTRQ